MEILKSFSDLIDDIPNMNIFENSLSYDIMKVSLNELKDQIDITIIVCFYGII